MDEFDKKIKNIWARQKKSDFFAKQESCPDDSVLFKYIKGLLRDNEKEDIHRHLTGCSSCLDLIMLNRKLEQEESQQALIEVPEKLIEKAMGLVKAGVKSDNMVFDVVLRFTRELIEIIKNPADLSITYGAIPVPVRGEQKTVSSNLISLRKTITDMEALTEIEKIDDASVNIKVTVKDINTEKPIDHIRLSLLNPDREIASYITENGEVYFENLRFGKYIVKVIISGNEIGRISMNIRE